MKIRHISLLVAAIFLFSGCAYKRLLKEAVRYESVGLYDASVDKYIASLTKKNDYVDARIGLMRSTTRYAGQLTQKIDESYQTLNDNEVVDNYLKLRNLKKKTAPFQVDITIDSRTEGQYYESQNRYLQNHYELAQKLAEAEDFSGALREFEAVSRVDANYEQTSEMIIYCRCEPLYRQAVSLMNQEKYRKAYATFSKVLSIDANYNDALDLKKESLEKGMLTVAFLETTVKTPYRQIVDRIIAEAKTQLQKTNNPFLRIVDIGQTNKLLEEQKVAMANNIDLKMNIIPVRSHMSCQVIRVSHSRTKLIKTKMKGFLKEVHSDKTVHYKKVYYYECEQSMVSQISFSYSLRSVENGLVLLSNTSSPKMTDKIHFIEFQGGNINNLRKGTWKDLGRNDSEEDHVYDNFLSNAALFLLVNGRKSLNTAAEMESSLIISISKEMSDRLVQYNPEN